MSDLKPGVLLYYCYVPLGGPEQHPENPEATAVTGALETLYSWYADACQALGLKGRIRVAEGEPHVNSESTVGPCWGS